MTFIDSVIIAQAKGFPPKVLPCSPGEIVSITLFFTNYILNITSSSAQTAEIGYKPPLNAFPKTNKSGRTLSCSTANIFPVLPSPV